MMDDAKVKAAPPQPFGWRGRIILALLVVGNFLGSYLTSFQPYQILLVPPLSGVTAYLMLLLPFLWLPFYLVWHKTLLHTAWGRLIWFAAIFTFCSGCSLGYRFVQGAITNYDCQPTTEKMVVCIYQPNNQMLSIYAQRGVERRYPYRRIPNLPFMELVSLPQ